MAYGDTLENYAGFGIAQSFQGRLPARAKFQYSTDARVVTFETLGGTPRLKWLDRIVAAINSAILE
jgi:hypothetical protein